MEGSVTISVSLYDQLIMARQELLALKNSGEYYQGFVSRGMGYGADIYFITKDEAVKKLDKTITKLENDLMAFNKPEIEKKIKKGLFGWK